MALAQSAKPRGRIKLNITIGLGSKMITGRVIKGDEDRVRPQPRARTVPPIRVRVRC